MITLAVLPAAPVAGQQGVTISTAGGVLRVHAPALGVLQGELLGRLRDGRSLRLDFELGVITPRGGATVAKTRHSFNLSFDLWEERFAVTRLGTPPRSISHLKDKDSEAWCLDNLTIPLAELNRMGAATPFWIRLEYRVPEPVPSAHADEGEPFSLGSLVDALSRRRKADALGKSVEAGPFRLMD